MQAPKDAAVKWSEKQSAVYTGQTPPGEKKGDFTFCLFPFQLLVCIDILSYVGVVNLFPDTTLPLPSTYSPEYVESGWYEWWTKEGFFQPQKHVKITS